MYTVFLRIVVKGGEMNMLRLISIIIFLSLNLYSSPKNLILLITDGMGVNSMSFGDLLWEIDDLKRFSNYGFIKPYPLSSKYDITDSAAAGTAIACGKKTLNGRICVDENGRFLESIAYKFKKKGKSVGIVSNTRITHATPAVFYANHLNRDDEKEIAKFIPKSNFDLFMGGGWKYVNQIENDILKNSYKIIRKKDELNVKYKKIFAIFADTHMNCEIDRDENEPSLSEMADFAIKFLSKNNKGFILVLESGRIDHCEHVNDIVCLAYEMKELKKVISLMFDFISRNRDTLFIMMSDHSNGGLSLGRDGIEFLNIDVFKNAKMSVEKFMKIYGKADVYEDFKEAYLNAFGIMISYRDFYDIVNKKIHPLEPLNLLANIKWSTDQHEASYVPIFSVGPKSEKFRGFFEIDEIGNKLFEIYR